jgi:hypothetical protein
VRWAIVRILVIDRIQPDLCVLSVDLSVGVFEIGEVVVDVVFAD